jgi:hypothetical protein
VKVVSFTWILSFTGASPTLDVELAGTAPGVLLADDFGVWADELAGTASGVLLADDFGVWISGCVGLTDDAASEEQAANSNKMTMYRIRPFIKTL